MRETIEAFEEWIAHHEIPEEIQEIFVCCWNSAVESCISQVVGELIGDDEKEDPAALLGDPDLSHNVDLKGWTDFLKWHDDDEN